MDPAVKFPKDLDSSDPANYAIYEQKDYTPDFLIKSAVNFIDKNKNKPFFLYYPSPLPHVSLQAPKKWVDYYHARFGDEKPFLGDSYFPCRYPHATYAAMIATLDEQVGQIVASLKRNGLYENTIIMFCSDNGPAANAGVDPVFFNSGGPFRGDYGWGKGFYMKGVYGNRSLYNGRAKFNQGLLPIIFPLPSTSCLRFANCWVGNLQPILMVLVFYLLCWVKRKTATTCLPLLGIPGIWRSAGGENGQLESPAAEPAEGSD